MVIIAEVKVVERPKEMEQTPIAHTPTISTGFRPTLSANLPHAKLHRILPHMNAPNNQPV